MALEAFARAETIAARASAVLQACAERVGATHGAVYFLDLGSGDLVPEVALGTRSLRHALVPERMTIPPTHVGSAEDLTRAEASPDEWSDAESGGLAIYACRADSCVAVVRLDGDVPEPLVRSNKDVLRAIASLLLPIYEQRFAHRTLGSIGRPLDLGQREREFLAAMAGFASAATGTAHVVLREERGRTLRCLAVAGVDTGNGLRNWDLAPTSDYPGLAPVLAGETLILHGAQAVDVVTGRNRRTNEPPVRAVVASPVMLEGARTGILAFGTSARTEYTTAERDGFAAVASHVGLAIAARGSLTVASESLRVQTEAAAAVTAVEVGRSARHEAKGILDNCQHRLRLIARSEQNPSIVSQVGSISDELVLLHNTLSRMHIANVDGDTRVESASIEAIWREATQALRGALEAQDVAVGYAGPDVTISIVRDGMVHVFLNLMLNSIDAFSHARRRDRRIQLSVRTPTKSANGVSMVYSDTATGINPSTLARPAGLDQQPLHQLIFERGVTSKKHGSGFGLWLVRRILSDLGGSVDLLTHRNGVAFAIHLPGPVEPPART
jgi:nitrogen-specific signal transduction histidine kinase